MGYKVTHVELACGNKNCGKPFKVSMDAYKRKQNKDKIWKCNTCRLSDQARNNWKNKSESDKLNFSKKMKVQAKQTWKNMSPETKLKRSKKISRARIKYESSLSDRDKLRRSQRARDQMNKMLNCDPTLRDRLISQLNEYRKTVSPEKRAQQYKGISRGVSDYWANMSPEQYQELCKKRTISFNEHLENLRYAGPNKNESRMIELLSNLGIDYRFHQYNRFLHPDFSKIFPINPITNSSNVSGYHQWDFIIYTKHTISFIDVDGSIHDPGKTNYQVTDWNGNKFLLSDMISFYESQRPYQTDGLDAYVVQCYDDKITDETKVICLHDDTVITVLELLMILSIQNMTEDEIEKLSKIID